MLATQRLGRAGHWGRLYGLRSLRDAYCDTGYHYDANFDTCVSDYPYDPSGGGYCSNPANAAECNWVNIPDEISGGYCDDPANAAECNWTYDTTPDQTLPSDNGNSQIWAQIIAAAGKIGTQILSAGSTQYRTPYGSYAYGTGPYSALNPTLAQQYLRSRYSTGIIPGISNTTLILGVAGLIAVMMFMKR